MTHTSLESYPLQAIKIVHESKETLLQFESALLLVDATDIELSWFIDIAGISDRALLEHFSRSSQIDIRLYARTDSGLEIAGEGYFHPNLSVNCGAVKGDGELIGYDQIRDAKAERERSQ